MTDLPASVGYITVVAKGLLGIADSNDGGTQPDAVPLVARVEFTASNARPVVAIAEDPQVIIPLAKITCDLDANGNLRPPNDGTDTGADASGSLRLVAPDGPGIDYTGWQWTAKFSPGPGQSRWQVFTVTFGGVGGQTVDLGEVLSAELPPGVPAVVDPWLKAWAKDPDTLIVGALTYDVDGLLTTAAVEWPNGTPGTLTIVSRDPVSQRAKSWTITRGPLTYTQPTITFNGSGDPTVIPAITVA